MGRLLQFDELKSVKGIRYSRTSLRRLEQRGEFPKRFAIGGGGRMVWDESDIDKWIAQRKAARNEPGRPPTRRSA